MSSAFDKSPEPPRDPGAQSGHEDTSSLGYPAPSGYGGPPPGYGPPSPYGPPPGWGFAAPDHPRATTSLVLGILGLVLCQVVSPFAWVTSKRTLTEIDASQGRWGGRGQAQAGYVLGIVGTVLLALAVSFLLLYVVVAGIALAGFATGAG